MKNIQGMGLFMCRGQNVNPRRRSEDEMLTHERPEDQMLTGCRGWLEVGVWNVNRGQVVEGQGLLADRW